MDKSPSTVLYSETRKPETTQTFDEMKRIKKAKIAKWAYAFKNYAHTFDTEVLNSFNPELQFQNTKRDKLFHHIASNHSSNIGFIDLIKLYNKYTKQQFFIFGERCYFIIMVRPDLKICWFAIIRVCFFKYTWPVGKKYHFEMEKIALILTDNIFVTKKNFFRNEHQKHFLTHAFLVDPVGRWQTNIFLSQA